MLKILHFSPVRKTPEILQLHLESLKKLNCDDFELQLSFFDDNKNPSSSDLLKDFVDERPNAMFLDIDTEGIRDYTGSKRWNPELYNRITFIKDSAIDYFLCKDFDYLFLTDSDLIIHPETLNNLVAQEKDFVSMIFWTKFKSSVTYTPNSWYAKNRGFTKEDLIKFKAPGLFPVDFTGACTLLSRKLLQDKVCFKKIKNIEFLGEDKHFCIRAAVNDYQPYVSTYHPAFHIYDESFVEMGERFLNSNFDNSYLEDWLNKDWENTVEKMLDPVSRSKFKKWFTQFSK